MTARLRELAERWNAANRTETLYVMGKTVGMHDCARELLAILDAEGDGGAVIGWVFQHDETGRMAFCENDGVNNPGNFAKNNPRHVLCGPAYTHPARSGVVSDAMVNECVEIWNASPALGREEDDAIAMRAALTHFAKGAEVGGDAEDAARYRWLRTLQGDVLTKKWSGESWCDASYTDLDKAIDAAIQGERHER